MNISIAIDGPAGAGKSTIAKRLSKIYKLMYINTGAMYRAVTLAALKNNVLPSDVEALKELVLNLNMHFENDRLLLDGVDVNDEITSPYIANNVSNYAAIPEVREILVKLQQDMAGKYDVIMDGRDIGTVVLKNSKFKFFLTAAASERAKRRFNEFKNKGIQVNFDAILSDIIKRDYIDTHRAINPLTKAIDAIEIDTSFMDIDQVVHSISAHIQKGKS
ncbi:MAG: (d)CMP kinase [Clostridiaceae bacterium]|nr:(d)CMP kinase [Clostridiaceae bacterium]